MSDERISPNGPLKGKVALVTGASRGIGEAIAVRLAMAGAKVVISARTAESGDSKLEGSLHGTMDRIKNAGGEAAFIKADISNAGDRERLIAETTALYGAPDILVNNAAVTFFIPIADFTLKRYDVMMDVCVKAPFHLSQLVLPAMREKKSGAIINISSGAARHPEPPYKGAPIGQIVYGMCKAALERMSTGLARETYRDNVAVNVISPGLVATPGLLANARFGEDQEFEPPEVIAEAVFRLASADGISLTGRIDYAQPLLDELGEKPATLI
ncbi:MAG: SDR family oxidoreductase [Caulobacterales bacterium]